MSSAAAAAPEVAARASQSTSRRIPAFDGARGLMALFVVGWHSYLITTPYLQNWIEQNGSPGLKVWWPPFGGELTSAAIVGMFFILSGIVVSMPTTREGFSWVAYYPSRMLRLLLPVWAAVAFGIVLIVLIPRGSAPLASWLLLTNATSIDPSQILRESLLLTQNPQIDNPLWSLSWEVLFSLLLIVYVLLARTMARAWPVLLVAAVIALGIGDETHNGILSNMPAFLIGVVAATQWGRVSAAAEAINASRLHSLWWSLILVGALISTCGFEVTRRFFTTRPLTFVNHLLADTTIVGYAALLFLLVGSMHSRRFLGTRVMQLLGRASFSLYLVHVPIIASIGFLMGAHFGWVPVAAIPLSLLAAWGFVVFVEQPSHQLAKRVGASADAWVRSLRLERAVERRHSVDPVR